MSIITHHTNLPDTAQKTDFYSLVDNATATGIIGTDISSAAAISDVSLAVISTAGKVDGAALNNLANVPSGAGLLPAANVFPSGGFVSMWSGLVSAIPTGWHLCDGTNGTPDLRDKFIVCTKAGSDPGAVSGNAYVMPHTHTIPNHQHQINANLTTGGRTFAETVAGGVGLTSALTTSDGGGGATSSTGTATAYALAFIMRI